jgi:hypothetical protein
MSPPILTGTDKLLMKEGITHDKEIYISPHWAITTSWFGFSRVVRVFSIL